MTDDIEALNEFDVVQKPVVVGRGSEFYEKIALACKKLGNDQSLSVPISKFASKHFRTSMAAVARRFGVKIRSTVKGANVLIWRA